MNLSACECVSLLASNLDSIFRRKKSNFIVTASDLKMIHPIKRAKALVHACCYKNGNDVTITIDVSNVKQHASS